VCRASQTLTASQKTLPDLTAQSGNNTLQLDYVSSLLPH
jgi:hypothetical protein